MPTGIYKRTRRGEARRLAALRSPEVRQRISNGLKGKTPKNFKDAQKKAWEANRGTPSWNAGLKGYKSGEDHWCWGGKRTDVSGENHWNWKGGITSDSSKIRHSAAYRLWRTAVFERDDYTCQKCKTRGGPLNADHIKPFALYPELRLKVINGRTLCVPCHRAINQAPIL